MTIRYPWMCALALLAVACGAQPAPFASRETLSIGAVVPNATSIPRCGKLELTLDAHATFDNPFDPDDIDVWAELVSPSGRRFRANAFYFQPFRRRLDGAREAIESAGPCGWKLRFAPTEVGRWTYTVHVKDRTGAVVSRVAAFNVVASRSHGNVVRSRTDSLAFARSDGSAYVPVGINMAWGGARGTYDFDDWLPALSANGGNWIRLWMVSWNCAIEWTADNKGDWRLGSYRGLGVYSLDNAWKLDYILDRAEQYGVDAMLCLGTFGEFTEGGYFNEGQWKANPYNAANGGPCKTPGEFWTNETARRLYRRRLRYIAARYGWRTSIMGWEFWNEVPPQPAWIAEMARCLKGTGEFAGRPADVHGHLVSTSYGNEAVWRIPEIDFTMTHHYGSGDRPDHAPIVADDALRSAGFGKPHLMAEFGADYRKADTEYDPKGQGINLHNGLWSSIAAGNAGTAMSWWWDNWVHPKGLWRLFAPVRQFVDAVPWAGPSWRPISLSEPAGPGTEQRGRLYDVVLPATGEWSKSPVSTFVLDASGVRGNAAVPGFLYSRAKPDLRTTPTFWVNFPRAGRFVLHVNSVCSGATLRMKLDGQVAKEFRYDCAPVPAGQVAEYKSTELLKQYNCYQARYDKDYGIDVPAGAHSVQLDVIEGDWIGVDEIRLTNYRATPMPDLQMLGRTNGRAALVWIHNPKHNWKRALAGDPMPPVAASAIALRDLPAGSYTAAWFDTWKRSLPRSERVVSRGGLLTLKVPEVATDLAVLITPAGVRKR